MKDTLRQVAVFAATMTVIVINALANILPLNGQNTGEIANRFEVYFQPAGYVFSIWGVIYLAMIAYSIFQALPSQRQNPRLRRIGGWYIASSAANIAWLFLWHYEFYVATMFAMLALLGCLLVIYLTLRREGRKPSMGERWFVRVPFSIYLGWVSVATIANATAVFDYLGWQGSPLTPELWTAIMLAVGAVLGLLMVVRERDWVFPLVLAWAFAGIAVKFPSPALVYYSSWLASGIAVVLSLAAIFFSGKIKPEQSY
jgi:hypothetical protein